MNLFEWLNRQRRWSKETFGEKSTESILTHIEQEIEEVRDRPSDLEEWIDIAILALDGAMRQDYTPEEVCRALTGKQAINMGRQWIVGSVDEAVRHVEPVNCATLGHMRMYQQPEFPQQIITWNNP